MPRCPGVAEVAPRRNGRRHPVYSEPVPRPGWRCQTHAMELPQHWVTADGFSPHLGQAGGTLTVWGWSTESEADAVRVANQRLAEALERVAREGGLPAGHGYYPRVPLREPVLEEVDAASGALLGVVTRNRMGCEVLLHRPALHRRRRRARARGRHDATNAAGDGTGVAASIGSAIESTLNPRVRRGGRVPAPPAVGRPGAHADGAGGARRMPWRRMPCPPHPGRASTSVAESLACEPVWEFARRHPDLGVRVYRTAAGLRVVVTGAASPPSSDRARALLTELGSDPLYVELCATHDSYRARSDAQAVPGRRTRPVGLVAVRGRGCAGPVRGVGVGVRRPCLGVRRVPAGQRLRAGARPDEQRLVALHDARCRVGERLPLA